MPHGRLMGFILCAIRVRHLKGHTGGVHMGRILIAMKLDATLKFCVEQRGYRRVNAI